MSANGTDHLFLDARALGADVLLTRFPDHRGDLPQSWHRPGHRPDPGDSAAHYASGGVRTDTDGRVAGPAGPIRGLYACGEAACTGVHGANRLASNSLLEGLVFAARIGRDPAAGFPSGRRPSPPAARRACSIPWCCGS